MRVSVVGIGERMAGDDAVGLAVLAELERRGVPAPVRLHRLTDVLELLPVIEDADLVVLCDAVVAAPPGRVLELTPAELGEHTTPVSSHALRLEQVIQLSIALAPPGTAVTVRIVAVTIDRPERLGAPLSPEVAAAVEPAAGQVLELLAAHTGAEQLRR